MRQGNSVTWKQHLSLQLFCQMLNAGVFVSLPRLSLGWSGWKACGEAFNEMVLPRAAMSLIETLEKMKK